MEFRRQKRVEGSAWERSFMARCDQKQGLARMARRIASCEKPVKIRLGEGLVTAFFRSSDGCEFDTTWSFL
ncbi:MAG: hypothetical protein C5B49_01195 [Bdellovibrio sp.]|nr:MAG: hypothetical protein C5B49_01195 [Bdellovibrio sp.]